jgi:hypothetical protein
MSDEVGQDDARPAKLPPAWFKHAFWRVHRALNRVSGGRFLWTERSRRGWGAMRLTTVGRRSGRNRTVIVGYLEDGSDLEAHPDAVVQLSHQRPRPVRARRAVGEERERLWQRWATVDQDLDQYAAMRTNDTPIVVFEPRDVSS